MWENQLKFVNCFFSKNGELLHLDVRNECRAKERDNKNQSHKKSRKTKFSAKIEFGRAVKNK
jgi:hypothetical protein